MRWHPSTLERLAAELEAIRSDALRLEAEIGGRLGPLVDGARDSARNLIHYLALRHRDNRVLQRDLAALGLSSLGRAESHVLWTVNSVVSVLRRLLDRTDGEEAADNPVLPFGEGRRLLEQNTHALLGVLPATPHGTRSTRIMVTMPAEAATNYELVRGLVEGGMDCMRINCAHDDRAVWKAMADNLRRARQETGKQCRLLMDLAGPKLRTGAIEPGPQVVHWEPERDVLGASAAPALVWLAPAGCLDPPPPEAAAVLPVVAAWLERLEAGDRIIFRDMRGKMRRLVAGEAAGKGRWAESWQIMYVGAGTLLRGRRESPLGGTVDVGEAMVTALPPAGQSVDLAPGDTLVLTREQGPARPVRRDHRNHAPLEASIGCTLPEVFAQVKPGERVWFDDGKIGATVVAATPDEMRVAITHCPPGGKKLRADKGINLPDSDLRLPALTEKDLMDLDFVVEHADLVGLSFVKGAEDIRHAHREIAKRTTRPLGMVIKIETRRAFSELPGILLAALERPPVGVMIARGDLAVECGYERLAEVQEEILWLCEAAHVPTIWATQVLESMNKKGTPSRAEVTDAAMGERAECVMLNKGAHVLETVRLLDDVLGRMQAHQEKKTSLLRALSVSRIGQG